MADAVLFITSDGYGKVVEDPRDEFPPRGLGGKGVISFKGTEDDSPIVATEHVQTGEGQCILITTANGQSLMTEVDDITPRSRNAGGIKLMDVAEDDEVVSVLV